MNDEEVEGHVEKWRLEEFLNLKFILMALKSFKFFPVLCIFKLIFKIECMLLSNYEN